MANVLCLEVIVDITFQPAISISVATKVAAGGVDSFTSAAVKC